MKNAVILIQKDENILCNLQINSSDLSFVHIDDKNEDLLVQYIKDYDNFIDCLISNNIGIDRDIRYDSGIKLDIYSLVKLCESKKNVIKSNTAISFAGKDPLGKLYACYCFIYDKEDSRSYCFGVQK